MNLCITLVIYQESLHDAWSTKCKIYLWLLACSIYFTLYYLPVAGVCDIPPVKCLHNIEVVGFGLYSCPVVSVQSVAVCTATLQNVEILQRRTDKLLVHLKYVWWLVLICIINS